MSAKYHVNPETGNPNKCTAKAKCPFGGDEKHYFSKEAAQLAFEKDQSSQVNTLKKPSVSRVPIPSYASGLPDLPGGVPFTQAWSERFEKLSEWRKTNGDKEPFQKEPGSLLAYSPDAVRERGSWLTPKDSEDLEDLEGVLIRGDYVVVVHTRQGGGNRECWCDDESNHESSCISVNNDELQEHPDYLGDRDDSFDSTYANFYFDAGITEDQAQEFLEENKRLSALKNDSNLVRSVESMKTTPWGAISDDTQVGALNTEYRHAAQRVERSKDRLNDIVTTSKNAEKALKKANVGTVDVGDLANTGIDRWKMSSIVEYSKKTKEAKDELEKMKQAHADAEKMPAGPLRDYLLADRGTFQYQTTESKGRRKVSVTKTANRGTLLGSEVESKESSYNSNKRILDGYTSDLEEIAKKGPAAQKEFETDAVDLEAARKKAWAAGWYRDPREIPAIPNEF